MLQTPDVNGPFFRGVEVAAAHTEVRRGANHAAGETQGVVRENGLGRSIVVLKPAPSNVTNNKIQFNDK